MKIDGRKNNGGSRNAGRKKGIGIASDIKKHCEFFISEILKDDAIKLKATKQLSLILEIEKELDCFYIIRNEGNYKLGFSSNIKQRYNNYKSHLGFVDLIYIHESNDANIIETYFHNKYKDKRIVGEYFNLTENDILDITSYCSILKIKQL